MAAALRGGDARLDAGVDVAALSADARDEERELGSDATYVGEFVRVSGAHHETELARGVL